MKRFPPPPPRTCRFPLQPCLATHSFSNAFATAAARHPKLSLCCAYLLAFQRAEITGVRTFLPSVLSVCHFGISLTIPMAASMANGAALGNASAAPATTNIRDVSIVKRVYMLILSQSLKRNLSTKCTHSKSDAEMKMKRNGATKSPFLADSPHPGREK